MTVKKIELRPGWLRRGIERAVARVREWEKKSHGECQQSSNGSEG